MHYWSFLFDDYWCFLIDAWWLFSPDANTGGLDTTDITKLMNATLITVGLLNTDNPQVNTILVLPPKFQLAILEYL